MDQKGIEAAVVYMRIFLAGLALNFDADFHELEEIVKRRFFKLRMHSRRFLEWGLSLYGSIVLGII